MIYRSNFRGCIADVKCMEQALVHDKDILQQAVNQKKCLTVALYKHENMLFVYMEALEEGLRPETLFPNLSKHLLPWPQRDGLHAWAKMYTIYYHAIPKTETDWARTEKKVRRGRIAYLKEDKMWSYVYYHKAIVDEGLLEGDKYQFIALHEDILFSYFEEPKCMTHINKSSMEESQVIDEWIAQDPESHFDHDLSGDLNFLFIEEVYSVGAEIS